MNEEERLTRLRAERLTPAQLTAEIARIDHAKTKAARPQELARYDRRRAIYAAELERQGPPQPPASAAMAAANRPPTGSIAPDRTWD